MPIYVYETIRSDGKPGKRFECQQSIHDNALTRHPKTDEPMRRIITTAAPFLNNGFDKSKKRFDKTDRSEKQKLIEKRQARSAKKR